MHRHPRPPTNIEIEVRSLAKAAHFRNAARSGSGCGGGSPVPIGPASDFDEWHITAADNAVFRLATFVSYPRQRCRRVRLPG